MHSHSSLQITSTNLTDIKRILPKKIYRYTKKEYAREFTSGKIAFRTASRSNDEIYARGVRDDELNKSVIGYNTQSNSRILFTTQKVAIDSSDNITDVKRKLLEAGAQEVKPISMGLTIKSPTDYGMVCFSTLLKFDLYDEFNVDYAIEIDTYEFISSLVRYLESETRQSFLFGFGVQDIQVRFGTVHYIKQKFSISTIDDVKRITPNPNTTVFPCLLKSDEFQHQSEFRVCCIPTTPVETLTPERDYIYLPSLTNFAILDRNGATLMQSPTDCALQGR